MIRCVLKSWRQWMSLNGTVWRVSPSRDGAQWSVFSPLLVGLLATRWAVLFGVLFCFCCCCCLSWRFLPVPPDIPTDIPNNGCAFCGPNKPSPSIRWLPQVCLYSGGKLTAEYFLISGREKSEFPLSKINSTSTLAELPFPVGAIGRWDWTWCHIESLWKSLTDWDSDPVISATRGSSERRELKWNGLFLSSEFHVIEIKHLKAEASRMSSFLITSQKSLAGRASRQQLSGDSELRSLQCLPGRAGYRPGGEESGYQGREASASLSFREMVSHFSPVICNSRWKS